MGQQSHGILWGVERPKDIDFNGDYTAYPQSDQCVFPRFKRDKAADIAAVAERLTLRQWDAERRFIPDMTHDESDDEQHLLGFWVSIGGSGLRGIPYLGTFPLADLTHGKVKPYARALKNARIRWRRFASWCATENIVTLPKPQLWLTITETA